MGLRDIADIYRELDGADPGDRAALHPHIALHRIDRAIAMLATRMDTLRLGYGSVAQEADSLRRRNKELEGLLNQDLQTGLPNRRVFNHELEDMLSALKGSRRLHHVGLLFLGLDVSFEKIKQTLGYTISDTLLFITAHVVEPTGTSN